MFPWEWLNWFFQNPTKLSRRVVRAGELGVVERRLAGGPAQIAHWIDDALAVLPNHHRQVVAQKMRLSVSRSSVRATAALRRALAMR